MLLKAVGAGLFLGETLWASGESTAPGTTTAEPTWPRPSVASALSPVELTATPVTTPKDEEVSSRFPRLALGDG